MRPYRRLSDRHVCALDLSLAGGRGSADLGVPIGTSATQVERSRPTRSRLPPAPWMDTCPTCARSCGGSPLSRTFLTTCGRQQLTLRAAAAAVPDAGASSGRLG
jgi:hypothetical protein